MLKIVPYQAIHKSGIEIMTLKISEEFKDQIVPIPTNETPVVPDQYWVAIHNRAVVGTVGVLVVANDFGVLKKMMLHKEFRGKEAGISKKLLETVIKWCTENKVSKLYLGTMHQFKAAQSFYTKNGFTRISKNELPTNFLQNPLDSVFFVRDLTPKI